MEKESVQKPCGFTSFVIVISNEPRIWDLNITTMKVNRTSGLTWVWQLGHVLYTCHNTLKVQLTFRMPQSGYVEWKSWVCWTFSKNGCNRLDILFISFRRFHWEGGFFSLIGSPYKANNCWCVLLTFNIYWAFIM